MKKQVVIIGTGIAGLSAGCYARLNGFEVTIVEKHTRPGGLCASWIRKGYNLNGCVHWLIGTHPGSQLYSLWNELGVLPGIPILPLEEWSRIKTADGTELEVSVDMDHFYQHLCEIAPEDREVLRPFFNTIKSSVDAEVLPFEVLMSIWASDKGNISEKIKELYTKYPVLRAINRFNKKSMLQFSEQLSNPFLKKTFPMIFGIPDLALGYAVQQFAYLHKGFGGFPEGGSQRLTDAIEKKFLELGGKILYDFDVSSILVKGDRANGVRRADGEIIEADHVISAADGYETIFELLGGNYLNSELKSLYENGPIFPPAILCSIGFNCRFPRSASSALGHMFELETPVSFAGAKWKWIPFHLLDFDRSLAPEGGCCSSTMMYSDFHYWKKLSSDQSLYRKEKENTINGIVNTLKARFPEESKHIDIIDLATPYTFNRYTRNQLGTFAGWSFMGLPLPKTLPGLGNFLMCGQWVQPAGGLPAVALSGRHAIQMLCEYEKIEFTSFSK